MDRTGLINNILDASGFIEAGRKGLATDGGEHKGRMDYEKGLAIAMSAFKDAYASADSETIMLAEEAFLQQEQQFCGAGDSKAYSSLTLALQSFDDAFRCIKIVENSDAYHSAEATYPTTVLKCRYRGLPKDSLHYACMSHYTRLQNIIRSPGINVTEKLLLEQRSANMKIAQHSYIEKQKRALSLA
jgi:hypothetical protein